MLAESGAQVERVVEGAQIDDVSSGLVSEREAPGSGSGGQEQPVIGPLSVAHVDVTSVQVDVSHARAGDELDLLVGVPLAAVDEHRVWVGGSQQQPLGQRRTFVRRVRLGSDQGDVAGIALDAQLLDSLGTGKSPTDHDDVHPGRPLGEREELRAAARIVPQLSEEGRGGGAGADSPCATQAHAGVLGLDDHSDTSRLELVLQVVGDAFGESFLGLGSAGVKGDQPGELRETEDALARQVPDVRDADEGQHVVLAERLQRQVLHQYELVVTLVVGERGEVELRAAGHLDQGPSHPARGLDEVLVVQVQAQGDEQVSRGPLRRGGVDVRPRPRGPGPPPTERGRDGVRRDGAGHADVEGLPRCVARMASAKAATSSPKSRRAMS